MPKSNLTILIRLDADHHVGLAHAIRIAKILSLVKSKFECHLIGNLSHYDNFFDSGTQIHPLPSEETSEQEKALIVVETATRIGADILVVDQPHLTKISWDIFARSFLPVIAIDDEGGPVRADLIFNGTILNAYHQYPDMVTDSAIHCGGDYALINPCFGETQWSDPVEKGLITVIGSGDRACAWAIALTDPDGPLSALETVQRTMIVGAAFPQIAQLEKNCNDCNINLHQGLDQPAMAKMLSQHSLGLITGGMIVYESLAAGLPVIVFPQEKNLPPEAHFFSQQNSIIDLEYDGGMDMELVGRKIKKMMDSREKRLTLSRNARQLIDGKGMLRTVEALDLFFQSIKERNIGEEHLI